MKTARVSAWLLALAVFGATSATWASTPAGAPPSGTTAAVSPGEIAVKGRVDAVTVYRGQALVTRVVEMPAGQGLGEYVVSDLPERIIASSIFAEGGDGVEVRSVRYRERPVAQDVREEVRKIDDQLQKLNDQIAIDQKQMQVLGEQRAYLDKLAAFTAPTATTEMTKGVLNADQLKTLTNYQFETRQTIATSELKLQQEMRGFQDQASLLSRQKVEIAGKSSKTLREAVIFTNRDKAGGTLRLRYLVDNATWTPSYNIRADSDKKTASLEYLASIAQMSGEDWGNVTMTLSTASPSLVAAAPTLAELQIALTTDPLGGLAAYGRGGRGGGGAGGGAGGGFGGGGSGIIDLNDI
ncbi:MAG TPA: mucoidy inhibitor MuiA family protein, partial [Phycisphaerae bacterium]